jgi:hypothetical protein
MRYDERECPGCRRTVCMYEQPRCQSCTPQLKHVSAMNKPDTRTKSEIWSDFYKNGFQ